MILIWIKTLKIKKKKLKKFDYFGLDRLVYKKPIVDEGDYLCTFVVLFDKEEKITSVYCD